MAVNKLCNWLAFYAVLICAVSTYAVEFDMLSIADMDNPADRSFGSTNGTVRYEYNMASNEVTTDQYVEFLNAVAKSDPHSLYEVSQEPNAWWPIVRSGEDGSYSYTTKSDFGNKPMGFVAFWDAARFANWMHNGQPVGPQNEQTTEDGAYFLGGETFPDNELVTRKPGAKWFLPNEVEWYKAALYDPRDTADGGPPRDDHYWRYGTMSDFAPEIAVTNAVGDVINPGPNVANMDLGAIWGRRFGNPTTVGSAESVSYYGLFDAAGNMWEWNDTFIRRTHRHPTATFRGNRGASWDDPVTLAQGWIRSIGGTSLCGTEFLCFTPANGFRMASIHDREFADFDDDGAFDVDDIDLLASELRAENPSIAMDVNMDAVVDMMDHRELVLNLVGVQYGDANLDGAFNSTDFVSIFQAGEYDDGVDVNSTWRTGDWNGDGEFDSQDFVVAMQNSTYESTAAQLVPEPRLLAAALCAGGFMLVRRRSGQVGVSARN